MELLIIPALLFFIYAVIGFVSKPHFAVTCILLVSVVNAWLIKPPSIILGLNIYLYDAVFIALLLSLLVRFVFKNEWRNSSPLLMCYGFIIFLGLFTGVKQFGMAAGVDFRNFFYYWTGGLYFSTFAYSKEMLDRVAKYWLLVCTVLLLVVYFRFVADFLRLPISATWIAADSTGVRFRVISSGAAYLLSISLIILFHRYVLSSVAGKPSRLTIIALGLAIIVLQHRSVWVATITSVLALFFLPGIKRHQIFGKLAGVGVIGMILLLPLIFLGYADSFISTVSDSAERATNLHTGTFGGRMKAWDQIMGYWFNQGFFAQLLGDPFGSGYAGLANSPHNFFYQSLLRAGILGNLLISFFYIGTLFKLYINVYGDNKNLFYPALFFIIIAGQMIYYIPYSIQPEHGILIGIAASLARRNILIENNDVSDRARNFLKQPAKFLNV